MTNNSQNDPQDKAARELDRQLAKYLLNAGIPKSHLRKSLKEFGKNGEFFSELFSDPVKWRDYFEGKPVLNMYGVTAIHSDLLLMIKRAFLLKQQGVMSTTLKEIYESDYATHKELQTEPVIYIPHVFNNDMDKPFTTMYTIEDFILRSASNGHILLLDSTSPIELFGERSWYSHSFIEKLKLVGRDFNCDARN